MKAIVYTGFHYLFAVLLGGNVGCAVSGFTLGNYRMAAINAACAVLCLFLAAHAGRNARLEEAKRKAAEEKESKS